MVLHHSSTQNVHCPPKRRLRWSIRAKRASMGIVGSVWMFVGGFDWFGESVDFDYNVMMGCM